MSEPGDRAPKWICLPGAQAFNVVEGHGASPKNGRGDRTPPGVQGARRVQKSLDWKLGDLGGASPPVVGGRQLRESNKQHAVTITSEKSDEAIVPVKSAKMWVTPIESMEGRAEAKGNSTARNASSTQREQDAAQSCSGYVRDTTEAKGRMLSHLRVRWRGRISAFGGGGGWMGSPGKRTASVSTSACATWRAAPVADPQPVRGRDSGGGQADFPHPALQSAGSFPRLAR